MDNQDVVFTKQNGIATLRLNRPDKMNALIPGIVDGIYEGVEEAVKDEEVRVLIITGTGRAFCAGGDVKSIAKNFKQKTTEMKNSPGLSKTSQISLKMQRCDKPIIASINGIAVGGGLDLALACDIRIASDRAQLGEIYIRRGIVPVQGGTFYLPRLVGIDKACQLIWTGDLIDAKEAERIGLVTSVVPHEELENSTMELAEKLAKAAPLAIQRGKRVIYDGLTMDLESTLKNINSILKEISHSDDHKEGVTAFDEKREPFFKGK